MTSDDPVRYISEDDAAKVRDAHREISSRLEAAQEIKREIKADEPEQSEAWMLVESLSRKEGWGGLRTGVAKIVSDTRFEMTLGAVILFNMYLVTVDTDSSARDEDSPLWSMILNRLLLGVYCVELGSRIYVWRERFHKDAWNIVDVCVIGMDVAMQLLSAFFSSFPSVSILRIFRLVRLAKAYKVLKVSPELAVMMRGLMGALGALFWGMSLIFIVLTIWGILAVQIIHPLNQDVAKRGLYEGCDRCPRAFESVFQSVLTFVQQVVAGDSWGTVSVPIIELYPVTGIFFVAVLASVQLVVMNMILAGIVDCAMEARKGSLHELAKERHKEAKEAKGRILDLCQQLDEDAGGSLTLEELQKGMEDIPVFSDSMEALGIDQQQLPTVFKLMDRRGEGSINYKDFVDEIFLMQNSDPETVMVFNQFYVRQIHDKLVGGDGVLGDIRELVTQELRLLAKDASAKDQLISLSRDVEMIKNDLKAVTKDFAANAEDTLQVCAAEADNQRQHDVRSPRGLSSQALPSLELLAPKSLQLEEVTQRLEQATERSEKSLKSYSSMASAFRETPAGEMTTRLKPPPPCAQDGPTSGPKHKPCKHEAGTTMAGTETQGELANPKILEVAGPNTALHDNFYPKDLAVSGREHRTVML